ncbi:MAG: histone deacetylase [Betaproteobacteria bacterium]|nr:histone deacetylase [Betaproteobacteria bacterium]
MKIFYTDLMVADSESFSPSAHKPREVVQSWQALGIPLEIVAPEPVTVEQFALAHDRRFVEDVLACRRANGFGNRSAAVAASLPYTSGSMLAAAREAVRNGRVAVAPCSGFHHATYDTVQGFCTFNGLMVTACALRVEVVASRVGILDFDQHWGNGTDDILRQLGADWVRHYSAGAEWDSPKQATRFLDAIPQLVESMADCGVILYQAGADPHVDDPLGGWLTTEQLRERDRLVFENGARVGVPIAWNLAGGYQTPLRNVLDIHDNTMRECAAVFG